MKRDYYIGIVVICVVLLIGAFSYLPIAQTTVTWEGILPGISTELGGTYAINVAYTASTVGWDVSEESALTNTVQEIMSLTHTTSGTPANGIGLEWVATQETSANNSEDVGAVQFYMSDTTATSEDASFGVELMAAGAAKAEVLTVSSVGALAIDSGFTANADEDDSDSQISSDNVTDAFKVDAGTDRVDIGTWGTWQRSAAIEATGYSITATDRAQVFDASHTDTGAMSITLDTDLVAYTGLVLVICDTELNANNNNVSIGTEGAETINEAEEFVMNAAGECVWVQADGTNWQVIGGYLE